MKSYVLQMAGNMQVRFSEEEGLTREDNNWMNRVSLSDQKVEFSHRENPLYVQIILDEQLSRQVLLVKNLRNFFPLVITHTWEGVQPGVFQVAIRMKIGVIYGRHPVNYMTEFMLRWPGGKKL